MTLKARYDLIHIAAEGNVSAFSERLFNLRKVSYSDLTDELDTTTLFLMPGMKSNSHPMLKPMFSKKMYETLVDFLVVYADLDRLLNQSARKAASTGGMAFRVVYRILYLIYVNNYLDLFKKLIDRMFSLQGHVIEDLINMIFSDNLNKSFELIDYIVINMNYNLNFEERLDVNFIDFVKANPGLLKCGKGLLFKFKKAGYTT